MVEYHYMTHPNSDGLMFKHLGASWECPKAECRELFDFLEDEVADEAKEPKNL